MNWNQHKKQLLANPKFKNILDELKPEYEIARAIIKARTKQGLTQNGLAKRLKTQQSVISRIENAQTTASISFLKRLAHVFGGNLKISFEGI